MLNIRGRRWFIPQKPPRSIQGLAVFAFTALGGTLLHTDVEGAALELSRWSVDGGGIVSASGGDYELSGTIGQPDAGILNGADFTVLTGGFWFSVAPGDGNEDGAVDLIDFDEFEQCAAGPLAIPLPACDGYDLNGNGHVDLRDFAGIQTVFTGGN